MITKILTQAKEWIAVHKATAAGIAAGVVLIAVALILLFTVFLKPAEPVLSVGELLSLGEKCLLELDYEMALVQFMKVIETELKIPRGYTGAAEAYIGLGDTDSAVAVLQQGLNELPGDDEIQAMLDGMLSEPDISISEIPTPQPLPTPDIIPPSISIFDVTDIETLDSALSYIGDNGIINICNSFTYFGPITFNGKKNIIISLNGYTLTMNSVLEIDDWMNPPENIRWESGRGIMIYNGAEITIRGPGMLDIVATGSGISASGEGSMLALIDGAVVNSTSLAPSVYGVFAQDGAAVTVTNATVRLPETDEYFENAFAVLASDKGVVNVVENAIVTGLNGGGGGIGASAWYYGTVIVGGNSIGGQEGVVAWTNGTVIVYGDAVGGWHGVDSSEGGIVYIYGIISGNSSDIFINDTLDYQDREFFVSTPTKRNVNLPPPYDGHSWDVFTNEGRVSEHSETPSYVYKRSGS